MKQDEFRRLAETYGADVGRWPGRIRDAAQSAAREPWAAAILRDAAALDGLLAAPPDEIDPRRADRAMAAVNARIAAQGRGNPRFAWLRGVSVPLSGMAAAGLLGAVLGFQGVAWPGSGDGLAELLVAAIASSDPSFLAAGG